MAIGERIRYFRNKRGMTQKYLGTAVGFPEKSADVRLAQYESGTRSPKAELTKALAEMGEAIDFAIDVDVPDENIISRMSGRRACLKCGATYHTQFAPPAKEGVCDVCGSELVLRDDDKPETVKNRLKVYHEQTQPLIDYYKEKGVLHTVDGTQTMEAVFQSITEILGA